MGMSFDHVVVLAIVVGLVGYLVATLVRPDKF